MPSTVLIITNDHDEHATAVIEELHRRDVPVFRFHPEGFPQACSVSMEIRDGRIQGEIRNAEHRVALDDICAAWYRRSRNLFAPTPNLNLLYGDLENYVKVQSTTTLAALFASLRTLWVGHPATLRQAEIKALQLAEASKAGLKAPSTLISNDPARAAAFVDGLRGAECAIKPLIAVRASDGQADRLPLTTILPPGHPLDSVALAPTIFQPYIHKASELRCVVIGERIFCAKLNSQANETTRRDWRAGDAADLEHEVFSLPEHVKTSIHRLMGSFGINFASIDLIVTPTGEFVFLDLNPNGQWLWLEIELGLPLVASMADLLTTRYSRTHQPAATALAGQREADHAA
jgi:glutathione synthase/RimK-type ligase-like ATP-grasp enzyme